MRKEIIKVENPLLFFLGISIGISVIIFLVINLLNKIHKTLIDIYLKLGDIQDILRKGEES